MMTLENTIKKTARTIRNTMIGAITLGSAMSSQPAHAEDRVWRIDRSGPYKMLCMSEPEVYRHRERDHKAEIFYFPECNLITIGKNKTVLDKIVMEDAEATLFEKYMEEFWEAKSTDKVVCFGGACNLVPSASSEKCSNIIEQNGEVNVYVEENFGTIIVTKEGVEGETLKNVRKQMQTKPKPAKPKNSLHLMISSSYDSFAYMYDSKQSGTSGYQERINNTSGYVWVGLGKRPNEDNITGYGIGMFLQPLKQESPLEYEAGSEKYTGNYQLESNI